jgi:hypothetical protein
LVLAISIAAFVGALVWSFYDHSLSGKDAALTTFLFAPGYALAFVATRKRLAMLGLVLLNVMTLVGAVSQVVFAHQS